jgi:hypothetical protein
MSAGLGERDGVVGAQTVIDALHHEIHEGEAFSAGHLFAQVAGSANADLVLRTGNKEAHLTWRAAAGGDSRAYIYEDTDADPDGTALTVFNKRRAATGVAALSASYGDTINAVGTLLPPDVIPGGSKNQSVGGSAAERDEWVLKRNATYLLRVSNVTGGAEDISIGVTFYEADPPGTYP